jgi:WD40 repeat protein
MHILFFDEWMSCLSFLHFHPLESFDQAMCLVYSHNSHVSFLTQHGSYFRIRAFKTWGDEILDREGKHKYILATGGADGVVKLWSAERPEGHWNCHDTLDHSSFENKGQPTIENKADPPQIYSLQFINHWKGIADGTYQNNAFLLTSSDDFVHLWEVAEEVKEGELPVMGRCKLLEVMSIHFTCLEDFGFGVAVTNVTNTGLQLTNSETLGGKKRKLTPGQIPNHTNSFGGARNPQHIIYVFDAQYCPANGLLGVALSDGSLRIMNGRGVCVTPVTLPGTQSHLTSFCWDSKGQRMATCVATGHLILWDILISQGQTSVRPGCRAILEGGHIPSRPLYGAKFCRAIIEQSSSLSSAQKNSQEDLEDDSEDLILSWGVDGRLCLWDSKSEGNVTAPLSTLVSDPQYSLYTVDVAYEAIVDNSKIGVVAESHREGKEDMNSKNEIVPNGKRIATIGCGGGGQGDADFLGVPVYLYDVKTP